MDEKLLPKAFTGIKLLPSGDALLFVENSTAKFVKYWTFILIGEFARKIEPLRTNKAGEVEALKANIAEIQFPFGINSIAAAVDYMNCIQDGHFKGTFHSKVQRVIVTTGKKSSTFKGRFIFPMRSREFLDGLL